MVEGVVRNDRYTSVSLPKSEILCLTRAASLQNRLKMWGREKEGNSKTHSE